MLSTHIYNKLTESLGFEPTDSQKTLLKNLANFTLEQNGKQVLIVRGYAGTGKTTSISAYIKVAQKQGFRVILLAPTGRAAKVLSSYSGMPAYTVHKKIYRQRSAQDAFGKFEIDKNLHSRTVFIVDEASMISNEKLDNSTFGSGYLLNDLMEYVFNDRGCKLILVGDTAQLPPVHLTISPALDSAELSIYSNDVHSLELKDVVRQSLGSGILVNATELRNRLTIRNTQLPLFNTKINTDFVRLSGTELLEAISDSYDSVGIDDTLVICRSNKRANKYNQGIRNQILWREDELAAGDILMVVKNNYFWMTEHKETDFIANGDLIEINKVHGYKELYGYRFATCTVTLIDYGIDFECKLLLDTLHTESASLSYDDNKRLYYSILEDYSHIASKRKQYTEIKNNEYFNALQVKYSYAVTCHKSQGGQWKHIYVDAGYLTDDMVNEEYIRWLYTAITRGTEKVFLVNFPEKFYIGE